MVISPVFKWSRPLALPRAIMRLVMFLGWSLLCRLVVCSVGPVALFSKEKAKRWHHSISLTWTRGIVWIMGCRLIIHGTPPSSPCFMVSNHLGWVDFFVGITIYDSIPVAEDPLRRIPIAGPLISGFEPIYIRRVKEDTYRAKEAIVEAIRAGKNIALAPETPAATLVRGRGVKRFGTGLLQAAIDTHRPVNAAAITYRTPPGYPAPADVLIFGPNPFYRTPDGKIPQMELDAYGPEKSFLNHLLGVLGLPYFEFIITFVPEPIWHENRFTLAKALHDAVERVFVPLE